MSVPNIFGPQTGPVPLRELDENFAALLLGGATVQREGPFTLPAGETVIHLTTVTYVTGVNAVLLVIGGSILSQDKYTESSTSTLTLVTAFAMDVQYEVIVGKLVASGIDSSAVAFNLLAPRNVFQKLSEIPSFEDFFGGAGGVIDNTPALVSAISHGVKVLYAPGEVYYFSSGITIPPGMVVVGASFLPGETPAGTVFMFALSTPTCVTLGGPSSSNGNAHVTQVSITRAAGAVPAGSIGLLNQNTYAVNTRDVAVYRQAIGFEHRGNAITAGISCMMTNCWTGGISDIHVKMSTWPELRTNQCRFGTNGATDVNCNAYISVEGGSSSYPAAGPNTGIFMNTQFNQGNGTTVGAVIQFVNFTGGALTDASTWKFIGCHGEGMASWVKSDATWTLINRVLFDDVTYNMPPGNAFLDLDPATMIKWWTVANSEIFSDFTVNSTPQIEFLTLDNVKVLGDTSITSANASSIASISDDCQFYGDLALAGPWLSLQVKGFVLGALTSTATGQVSYDVYPWNSQNPFTPTLLFGGSGTGWTFTTRTGLWTVDGNKAILQLYIEVSGVGSSTGVMTISLPGCPQVSAGGSSIGNSGNVVYCEHMASLTSPINGSVGLGPVGNLFFTGAAGSVPLTHANFTSSSQLAVQYEYFI